MAGQGNPYVMGVDLSGTEPVQGALKWALASGQPANALITVTGMQAKDKIVSVLEFMKSGGNLVGLNDKTGTPVPETNGFKTNVPTSGNIVLVHWVDQQV